MKSVLFCCSTLFCHKMYNLNLKTFIIFGVAVAFAFIAMANSEQLVGGITTLSGKELDEAKETLNNSLAKLASGDGPSYKSGNIFSVTRQVVAGTNYAYVVELIDDDNASRKCKVNIWSRPWLPDGIEVTFDCPGQERVVKKHSA